jgi:hypothetical protein
MLTLTAYFSFFHDKYINTNIAIQYFQVATEIKEKWTTDEATRVQQREDHITVSENVTEVGDTEIREIAKKLLQLTTKLLKQMLYVPDWACHRFVNKINKIILNNMYHVYDLAQ